MVATDDGKQELALLLGGSRTERPTYCAIGSGSGAVLASDSSLVAEFDRNVFTSTDCTVAKHVTYITDFDSVSMSGNGLLEFGISSSGTTMNGTLWNREGFAEIEFDGTNELQVQVDFEIF